MSNPPGAAATARLDAELVRRGLARSRAQAAAAIADGRVTVDGIPAAKPSSRVHDDQQLRIADADHYVARSAHKLLAALDAVPQLQPSGLIALDVGASTGGFTQVLLERGAREVIALDVGHDQLVPELRGDPRVRVVEGFNARDLTPVALAHAAGTDEAPGFVVADVSFISLTAILPGIAEVGAPDLAGVLLVKPQFEVGRQGVREGIVRDRAARHAAVRGVVAAAENAGLRMIGLLSSPVLGSSGNQEYLLAVRRGVGAHPSEWDTALDALP